MKKTKILVVTLLAGFVLHQSALCQTSASDANPTAASGASTNPPAGNLAGGGNQPVSITASSEPVSSVSVSNASPNTLVSNAIAAANLQTASNAIASAAAERPISLQDVPITTAIEALARQAGINYLLDPKIGYGQPDQNGQTKPEPTLSVRWENVTPQQALLALLDNYGLQIGENPKTGIARITTKEPNALPPLVTRVVQLQYASTSNMLIAVVSLLSDDRRSKVVPDARTSQLVVVATEAGQSAVDTLIGQLDKPTRQVLIETHLVELSSNPSTWKGIDWSGTLQAQNITFGNGFASGNSITKLPGDLVTISKEVTTLPVTTPAVVTPAVITPSGAIITPSTTTPAVTTPGVTIPAVTKTPGSSTATTLNSLVGNGGLSLNSASGLTPNIGFLSADGARAVLSFLNSSSEAQVVSTPRVVTLDNETATISVINQVPIVNVQAATTGVASGGSQVTYSNVGTILQVTPRITANDYILLKVVPDVSSAEAPQNRVVGGQNYTVQPFDVRHVETQVLIPNNHTLVIGGLVQDSPRASYTKVPILGDIPILGFAFRSEEKHMVKSELMIFITPTIVQDGDFRPSNNNFLNSQPRPMKDPMKMHTWWDSSQPRGDWSNPISPDDVDKTQNPDAGKASTP
jgi:type II secretory pathway component GspD/PulD (secretin)